ncbi:hypothetical protein BH11PLA2_BH11PLA2_46060 [soil metagenome]
MRKSSPRLLAGVLLLAIFASVGLMTARAFSVNSVSPTATPSVADTTSVENRTETRGLCTYTP